ncbi:MAG TPA: diacylglycerol kinase family protein, partial [Terriglobales bacterium]|nr:diacylglycerol kinase family protein [Terriglobales bacterium]
ETRGPGDGIRLARQAYCAGFRRFLAVGGDGTSCEIVNGIFPQALAGERPQLAFLPLGTGNSFLRDFTTRGEHATEALLAGRTRPCDVLLMTHREGVLYYINLLSLGFAADVAFLRHRRFQRYGELGYLLALLTCLARLERRPFPLRVDSNPEYDRRPCLFLTFNNSKFTGGKMMIAPNADPCDGLIEYVRWGPISRLGLLANLHTLYTGTHVQHPLASRQAVRQVEFQLDAPVNVMVDGEVLKLQCQRLDVLPGVLEVMA